MSEDSTSIVIALLMTFAKMEIEMKGKFLLDVAVRKESDHPGAAYWQGEVQSLGKNAFLILLRVVDGSK